jgi:hypothetical protein
LLPIVEPHADRLVDDFYNPRKVLVASLAHEPVQTEAMYLAGVLVLGLIFWLVSRAEARKR